MCSKLKVLVKIHTKPTEQNKERYKIYLNIYNKLQKEIRLAYFRQMLDKNENNMKNTWATLKKALGKLNNKISFPQAFLIENNHITDTSLIAESFNDYFSKIGK